MKTVQSYGYENVENALIEALAKTANISVLRFSNFLVSLFFMFIMQSVIFFYKTVFNYKHQDLPAKIHTKSIIQLI